MPKSSTAHCTPKQTTGRGRQTERRRERERHVPSATDSTPPRFTCRPRVSAALTRASTHTLEWNCNTKVYEMNVRALPVALALRLPIHKLFQMWIMRRLCSMRNSGNCIYVHICTCVCKNFWLNFRETCWPMNVKRNCINADNGQRIINETIEDREWSRKRECIKFVINKSLVNL